MARTKWIFGAQQSQSGKDSGDPVIVPTSSPDAKKFGLENFGNTCYANSVIQALYFCGPFRDLLIQSVDHSLSQIVLEQPPPSSPSPPFAPNRRKPERKPSTSGSTADAPNGVGQPPANSVPPIPSSPPSLFSALRSLFVYISSQPTDKGTVAPKAFIEKLRDVKDVFRSTQHQDAHEFLNYLLNKIVEEIEEDRKLIRNSTPQLDDMSNSFTTFTSKIPPTVTTTTSSNSASGLEEATLVHKLFEGILTSETRCLTCETVSSRDESFLDLSIDIEQNASVTACLRSFSASEMLCQKNKFFCDSCCDLQEAEKRMKIKKLPNVLALHLKRFKFQEDLGKYIKLGYRVAFPFELRLFNTVDDTDDADRLFNLFGIVVHIGTGPHHGHYISIIKTQGSWQVFDDDNVYPIVESEIPKYFGESNAGSAYILFYQAADIDLPALGLRTFGSESERPISLVNGMPPVSPSQHSIPVPASSGGDEADSSDLSELAYPLTPSSQTHSPLLSFADKPRQMEVVTSFPDEAASSGTVLNSPLSLTPTQPNTIRPPKQSIFRRTPSIKLTGGPDPKSADADPPPVPPPQNLPPSPTMNGKTLSNHKEPERKPSIWFPVKRKSFKASERKSTSEHEPPASPATTAGEGSQTTSAPNTWFRNTNHHPKDSKTRRRPSAEPAFFDISAFATLTPPRPNSTAVIDSLAVKSDGFESPSPGSASSSIGSTSIPQYSFPPEPMAPAADPLDFPPQRKSSLSDSRHPEHKKSVPEFPKNRTQTLPAVRPSSASAAKGDRSSIRPLPPVPPIPPSLATPPMTAPPKAQLDEPEDFVPLDRRKISIDDSPTPFPGTSLPSNAPPQPTPHKTATRKLSMTGQIMGLGFVKKDKKEKTEKDKDSGRVPPSVFNQFSKS